MAIPKQNTEFVEVSDDIIDREGLESIDSRP